MSKAIIGAAAALTVAALAYGMTPRGGPDFRKARAIDGDTIAIEGRHYRLYGIDAPELNQLCRNQFGMSYQCGMESREWLAGLLRDQRVKCETRETDRYGRDIATCETANGLDIAAAQVRNGQAIAYVRYSKKYLTEQDKAAAEKTGLWRGTFTPPEQFRHQPAGQ